MSAYATSYALAKMFNLDVVMLKTQYDYLKPYFPNLLESEVVIEQRFCDHCKLPWIARKPKWFRMVRNRKAGIKRGVAITLGPYSNEPEFYKASSELFKNAFYLVESLFLGNLNRVVFNFYK